MTSELRDAPAVRCVGLRKTFGGIVALADLDLEIETGTIHALIGENGAGKSTCLGMLAGRITPTDGFIELAGERVNLDNPRVARRHGVAAIYQELTIVPALSSQANIFLANPVRTFGFLRERQMRTKVGELSSRLGNIPLDVNAGSLSVADQQVIEIARGLLDEPRLMLFDEPTSSLALPERESLFRVMRELRASGVTIVFVSHNLDEVLEISDAISVFRDGMLVNSAPVAEWTKSSLVSAMLGSSKAESVLSTAMGGREGTTPAEAALNHDSSRPELLRIEGLTIPDTISDIDLLVREGEILGLGGLVGSGRTSILRAIVGLEPEAKGRMWIRGKEVAWPRNPRAALRLGIALIPEDRKKQGLFMSRSATENIIISKMRATTRLGVISRRLTTRLAREASEAYSVPAERLPRHASELSGGNQQKLLFARWRLRRPLLLLADEPTRGVDVGAKTEILRSLLSLAEDGLGVILVSSELEEVVSVSHRVKVLSRGRFVASLEPPNVSTETILSAAFEVEM